MIITSFKFLLFLYFLSLIFSNLAIQIIIFAFKNLIYLYFKLDQKYLSKE